MKVATRFACVLLVFIVSLPVAAWSQFLQERKLIGGPAVGSAVYQGYSVSLSADGNTAIMGGIGDNADAGAAFVFTRSGSSGAWVQQGNKLVGTGAVGSASQGFSVALSADGNTAIVGGLGDNAFAGAAWVFTRSGSTWSQQGNKLVGTGAVGVAQQGNAVALSADGNTAIIGGFRDNTFAGAAWIFTRSGGVWSQQGSKLVAGDFVGAARQGISVALAADGNTAIVGGHTDNANAGAAWIYTRAGGTWSQQRKLVGTGAVGAARQGRSVSLSSDGNTALVGGYEDNASAGAAWVFTRSAGVWNQQGNKFAGTGATGNANQAFSVSLSGDGNTAILGGVDDNAFAGAAWIFTRSVGVWSQQGNKLVGTGAIGSAQQGTAVALSSSGNRAIVGGIADNANAGAAWVYSRDGSTFSRNNLNKPIQDHQNAFDTINVSSNSPLATIVRDVNVSVIITHPNVSDLEISLVHLGVTDTLAYQVGGTGDNFLGTVFDDSAVTPIANGVAPFSGRYIPTRPLAQFNSLDVAGSWILRVFDRATGNIGTLNGWTLTLGSSVGPSSVEQISFETPEKFVLKQNYPNPFNPVTIMQFDLPRTSFVTLEVFTVAGERVDVLVSETLNTGQYRYEWNAARYTSGVYFYRLRAGDHIETKKMILVK
ncbi:MAG: T9SS type A sorting domain-containing protein [Ignavibacteriae bacterium]|nr:T9SS type A sorting domain-containing protein [Ignavibacteriota bacterium]